MTEPGGLFESKMAMLVNLNDRNILGCLNYFKITAVGFSLRIILA